MYLTGYRFGSSLAALQFMLGVGLPVRKLIKATEGVNRHRAQSSERYLSDQTATEVLVKLELLPVTNYLPGVARIQRNGVRMFMAVGQWGLERKNRYVEADRILAEQS